MHGDTRLTTWRAFVFVTLSVKIIAQCPSFATSLCSYNLCNCCVIRSRATIVLRANGDSLKFPGNILDCSQCVQESACSHCALVVQTRFTLRLKLRNEKNEYCSVRPGETIQIGRCRTVPRDNHSHYMYAQCSRGTSCYGHAFA